MTKTENLIRNEEESPGIRLLLLGEPGVGKTTLLYSLMTDEFCEDIPPKGNDVVIPPDVTPEGILTIIHDYCAAQERIYELKTEIIRANVICIVYSVDNPVTIDKITSYWLPLIKETVDSGGSKRSRRPIILVGNKADEPNHTNAYMEKASSIMQEFEEVDTVVECSAKKMRNVCEFFYHAQKAVLYPASPLFVSEDRELTKNCKRALIRIFKLSDHDNDGLLNDDELNRLQLFGFGIPLSACAIVDLKRAVDSNRSDGIINDALTLDGFIYLNQLFISRNRHETTWRLLRRFGYDNELELSPEYLKPPLHVPRGCSTELTSQGIQFITSLFTKFDEDKDNCLSPSELQNMFSVCSTHMEYLWLSTGCVETNSKGWLTFNGYICFWVLTTFLKLPLAMELLGYLGFNMHYQSQIDAIRVNTDRKNFDKITTRNVLQCHVIGPKNAGKSVFIQSFAGRNISDVVALGKKRDSSNVLNQVKVKDESKYLLLHEVDVLSPQEILTDYEKSADIIVLLYDASDPDSFSYVANIYRKYFYRTRVPCVFISTKTENIEVEQNCYNPSDFCASHALPQPIRFRQSDIGRSDAPIFTQLATMAVYPYLKKFYYLHDSSIISRFTVGAAIAALAGFLLYKNF